MRQETPLVGTSAPVAKTKTRKKASVSSLQSVTCANNEDNATQSFFAGNELEACLNKVWDNDDDKGKGKFSVRMNKMLDDSKSPSDILQSFMDYFVARGLPKNLEEKQERGISTKPTKKEDSGTASTGCDLGRREAEIKI